LQQGAWRGDMVYSAVNNVQGTESCSAANNAL